MSGIDNKSVELLLRILDAATTDELDEEDLTKELAATRDLAGIKTRLLTGARATANILRRRRLDVLDLKPMSSQSARNYPAMGRPEMLIAIKAKFAKHAEATAQHRDLTEMTDDDLRSLLQDLDALTVNKDDGG